MCRRTAIAFTHYRHKSRPSALTVPEWWLYAAGQPAPPHLAVGRAAAGGGRREVGQFAFSPQCSHMHAATTATQHSITALPRYSPHQTSDCLVRPALPHRIHPTRYCHTSTHITSHHIAPHHIPLVLRATKLHSSTPHTSTTASLTHLTSASASHLHFRLTPILPLLHTHTPQPHQLRSLPYILSSVPCLLRPLHGTPPCTTSIHS